MGIRDKNVDKTYSHFARKLVCLSINHDGALSAVKVSGVIVPFAGTIVSAIVRCHTLTDADDSARVDLFKNGSSILAAAVDPTAADTTTTLSPTSTAVADGDLLEAVVTTGSSDAIRASLILELRPKLNDELVSSIEAS
jgi:hypothetical protein